MLEKRVIYKIPEMEAATRRNVVYNSDVDVPLSMDIYYPPNLPDASKLPVIIFVFGFPDSIILEKYGIKLKDAWQYVSWGQLAAATGIIAITYETTQPEKDIYSVLAYVRKNASLLQIDGARMGIWACSGNVPTALSVLSDPSTDLKCSVLYYGIMLDTHGSNEMEEFAHRIGAAYPCNAESIDSVSRDIPLFVVRAGEDNPRLNKSIEYFICEAIQRNLSLTFVNYSDGQHAFDVENDTISSQEIIKHTLTFLEQHLFKPL